MNIYCVVLRGVASKGVSFEIACGIKQRLMREQGFYPFEIQILPLMPGDVNPSLN
jgi:hypothetical protein